MLSKGPLRRSTCQRCRWPTVILWGWQPSRPIWTPMGRCLRISGRAGEFTHHGGGIGAGRQREGELKPVVHRGDLKIGQLQDGLPARSGCPKGFEIRQGQAETVEQGHFPLAGCRLGGLHLETVNRAGVGDLASIEAFGVHVEVFHAEHAARVGLLHDVAVQQPPVVAVFHAQAQPDVEQGRLYRRNQEGILAAFAAGRKEGEPVLNVAHAVTETLGTVEVRHPGRFQPLGNGLGAGQGIGAGCADHDGEMVGRHMAGLDLVAMALHVENLEGQLGQGLLNGVQRRFYPAAEREGLHDHGGAVLAAAPTHVGRGQTERPLHDPSGIGGVPAAAPEGDVDVFTLAAGGVGQALLDDEVRRRGLDGTADAGQAIGGKGQGIYHRHSDRGPIVALQGAVVHAD
ncbi:hypothetical protein DESC_480196 [Desulfosarcina cetonica]|nr:hypothetical protein DESC_480196 [Desulfosarcina cetonica]